MAPPPAKRSKPAAKRSSDPPPAATAPATSAAPPPPRIGARSGTRSHGQPEWSFSDFELSDPTGGAAVAASGAEGGGATTSGKNLKALAMLRDFLPKGKHDPAANSTWTSKKTEEYDAVSASRGISWGCQCQGHIGRNMGGLEMCCKGCGLYFHSRCERVSQSPEELQAILARHGYECMKCEEARLKELGFENGKFAFQCRFCGRTFDDQLAAQRHGRKCGGAQLRRQWNCACNGERGNAAAVQCSGCSKWYHRSCKKEGASAWERLEKSASLCGACDAASPERDRGNGRVARRAHLALEQEQQLEGFLAPSQQEEAAGTLDDGRVYVRPSSLGKAAGLGLFAGVPFARGEVITTYSGPLLYREQIAPDADTSYILRLPNSGGRHIDGKPFADAVRANGANPAADGRFYPTEGADEWRAGAASMCNDPRQVQLYNSRITFRKPQGASKALCELVPMRAILLATRDVEPHEEFFFNYGSQKPFEHLKEEQKREEREKREKKQLDNSFSFAWVPNSS